MTIVLAVEIDVEYRDVEGTNEKEENKIFGRYRDTWSDCSCCEGEFNMTKCTE